MNFISELSLPIVGAIFAAGAIAVAVAGTYITSLADRIADRSGLGEAITGGVFLGLVTSLAGTVVSLTAALEGRPSLAFSNAVGGIAAQTAFLAVGDLMLRKVNLEHAAAELANVFQSAFLTLMLSIPLIAFTGPEIAVWGMHPVSLLLPVLYVIGVLAASRVRQEPMWTPVTTDDTRKDIADEDERRRGDALRLYGTFAMLGVFLAFCGYALAAAGGRLSDAFGISETLVGATMTAVVTSLPELVTTLAAIRRGALDLAVGGIIGGNSFDVLFLTLADAGYQEGSIYHAIGKQDVFWITIGLAMTSVILVGMVLRERKGPANIGVESAAVLGLYVCALVVQIWNG